MTTQIKKKADPSEKLLQAERAKAEENSRSNLLQLERGTHERDALSQKKKKEEESKKEEDKPLVERIVKSGLSAITTNAVIGAVAEGVSAADLPDKGEVIDKMPSVEGEIIKGPEEGGGFLERPMAGAMAESSLEQSLEIQYGEESYSKLDEGSGTMNVNNNEIPVSEYLPGSDVAKLAMGEQLDAGDGLGIMMERGMDQSKQELKQAEMAASAAASSANGGGSGDGSSDGSDDNDEGRAGERTIGEDGAALSLGGIETEKDQNLNPEEKKEKQATETKIEREALEVEHKADLTEALRTQDVGETVNERTTKHGTLRMETQFEARNPDNNLEQKKGQDHISEAIRSPRNESSMTLDDMRFRTLMSEKENDKGISPF